MIGGDTRPSHASSAFWMQSTSALVSSSLRMNVMSRSLALETGATWKPAVVLEHDQAVGRQAHQCFAQRAGADAVAKPQLGKSQPGRGLQAALEDVVAQSFENAARERAPGRLPLALGAPSFAAVAEMSIASSVALRS